MLQFQNVEKNSVTHLYLFKCALMFCKKTDHWFKKKQAQLAAELSNVASTYGADPLDILRSNLHYVDKMKSNNKFGC